MKPVAARPPKRIRLIPTVRRSMIQIYKLNLQFPRNPNDAFLLTYFRQQIEYYLHTQLPQFRRPYLYRFVVN